MELLILFIVGLLIAILVLPFVALAKANSTKRGLDDLATRLSSLETEMRTLGRHTTQGPQPEAAVAAPKAFGVPPPAPITTAAPIEQEKESMPPPIPERFIKPSVPQISAPARPPINWEQFMGAKLFAWIGGVPAFLRAAVLVGYSLQLTLPPPALRVALQLTILLRLLIPGGGLLQK